MKRSKLWLQLPGTMDNGDCEQAYAMFGASANSWMTGLKHAHGVIIRSTALRGGMFADKKGDDRGTRFLRDTFLPFLKAWGLKLAVNCVSAGRAQCTTTSGPRSELLFKELDEFQRIADCGGTIDVFRLQSIVSGTIHDGDCMALYPKAGGMERRIEDVRRFLTAVRPRFPLAKFVVADTAASKTDADHSPEWDYQRMYAELLRGVRAAGHDLDAFHLAWSLEEMAPDLADVAVADDFFDGLDVKWGLTPATDEADHSAAGYRGGILTVVEKLQKADIVPNDMVLTSWKRFPDLLTPETDPITFTGVVADVIRAGGVREKKAASC